MKLLSRIIKSSLVRENIEEKYTKRNTENDLLETKMLEKKCKILNDAKNEKEIIINNANVESEKIINKAKNKADDILNEIYNKRDKIIDEYIKKGHNEGHEKGYEEGKVQAEDIINEALKIKEDNMNSKKEMINRLEEDIITVVIKACSKIINRLYDEDKEIMLSIIQKGLDDLNSPSKLTIKVSKDDYDFLEMYKNEIDAMVNSVEKIEIVIDKTVNKGGVIIETPKGSIDVGIDTQMNELKKFFKDLLNSE